MVNIIVTTRGGGLFSLFHQALEKLLNIHLEKIYTFDNFKIRISNEHSIKNKELFDTFFDYTNILREQDIVISDYPHCSFLKAWESDYYSQLRSVIHKNKIHPSIQTNVDQYKTNFKIDENTLAIHIRLTDMNIYHAHQYGYRAFDDFCTHIDKMLTKYQNINSIYVCSDNNESISELISKYSNYTIHYVSDTHRVEKEDSNNYADFFQNFNSVENIETKLFTELLVASSCSYFICRISDFANFAILYSNTFKEIDCIN